jgi:hypothetical protein
MKKKITLIAFTMLAAHGIWAQECDTAPFYQENFESAEVPALPDCSTIITPGGNAWATVDNPGSGFTDKTLRYTGNDQPADAWFFTNGIHMEANVYYKISYKYGNNGSETTENLTVTKGITPTTADAEVFATHDGITGGTPSTQLIELFMNPTEGTYYFGFHATSGADQGNLYVDDIVVTPVVCGTPLDIQVTDIGQNGATVSWSAPTGSNISIFSVYQYAVMETNAPPADGTYNGPLSVDVTGLDPATTYYVFTRSLCGPVWSDWTEAVIFTTPPCDPVAIPYYQDFEDTTVPDAPECTIISGSGNNWATVNNPGNGFETNVLRYEGNDEAADTWFFTQGIEMTAGTNYKITYTYGNDSADTTESLKAIMATSPNAASQSYIVNEITAITGGTSAIYTSSILGVPADGVYYLGFNANSAADQGNLYIDNIEVEEWDCGAPQDITLSNITSTSATVTWEAPEEATSFGYFVYFGTNNGTPENDGVYVNALTHDLTELEPGTTYYVFMKSQCGPLMGEWTEPVSFTTPACEAAAVPYSLDFETADVPGVPECTIAPEAISGSNWVTVNNPGSGFENNTLSYAGNDEAADAWFFTQGIELTAGTLYKVSYKYGNNSADTTESLKVTLNDNPNAEWVIGEFADHTDVTGGTVAENSVEYFNVPETGVYYFGFNAYSEAGTGSIYVDDFLVEEIECGVPSDVLAENITDSSADITWSAPDTGNASPTVYQYAFGTTDTPPAEGTFDEDMSVTLDELEPETTYYVFTRTQCGPIWSDWTVTSFTTETIAGIDNPAFSGFTVYPNPVKDIVTLANATNIDSVEIYNITGQVVYRQTVNSDKATINLQTLSAGAYLLNVSAGGETNRVKIIKE